MMRRRELEISEGRAWSILEKGEYGVLSTVSPDGQPYGVPLNYWLMEKDIYFHCSPAGMKLDNIKVHPVVSFCVVGHSEVMPGKFTSEYESCIACGTASEVTGESKAIVLKGLIQKYSENHLDKGMALIQKIQDKTGVYKITIQSISGKANRT